MRRHLLILLLIGANLLWGSAWVVAKLALADWSPLQVSAWRMIGAGLVVLPWLLARARRGLLPARTWPLLLALGLTGFVVGKFLNLWGLNLTSATNASLLMSVEPLFTIALGRLVLGEALTRRRLAAFGVGALGAFLLIARGLQPPDPEAGPVIGDLVFIAGLAAEAAYSVFGKSLLARHSAAVVTAATIVASLLCWVPLAGAEGLLTGWPVVNARVLAALAFLALGCTVAAYWAWFFALESLETGAAALTIFIQPVWGALLAGWLLGEPWSAATAAGGALVLVSLYLALVPGNGAGHSAPHP